MRMTVIGWQRRHRVPALAGLTVAAALVGVAALHHAGTSPILHNVTLSTVPMDLVVDAGTRRAFVTSFPYGTGPRLVHVLDLDSAKVLRTVVVGPNGASGAPPPALDERAARLIVASYGSSTSVPGIAGRVYVLDAHSGAIVRVATLGLYPQAIGIDEQDGRAVVTSDGVGGVGLVGVIDTYSGRLLHTAIIGRAGASPGNEVLIDPRTNRLFVPMYVRTGRADLRVLDARRGHVLGTIPGGTAPAVSVAIDSLTGHLFLVDAAGFRMVDERDGRLLRSGGLGPTASLFFPVVDVDEPAHRAFIATSTGVQILDTRTGALVRTLLLGQYAGPLAVDRPGGRVFLLFQPRDRAGQPRGVGSVYVLDERSGATLHTNTVGVNPVAIAVDARRGRVLVLNRGDSARGGPALGGSVSVLDASGAAPLATIPVGPDPIALAVDAQTGHAIVLDGGGPTRAPDPWGWLPPWAQRLPFMPKGSTRTRNVPASVAVLDVRP